MLPKSSLLLTLLLVSSFGVNSFYAKGLPQKNSQQPASPCKPLKEPQKAVPLQKGKSIATILRGGETHTYLIKLTKGEFAHVVVTQKGVDVALTLLDSKNNKKVPKEKTVDVVDSPNGTMGQEFFSFIGDAEKAETYQLKVSSLDKQAPVGCYEIKLEEKHQARPEDLALISAEAEYLEGEALRRREQEVERPQDKVDTIKNAQRIYENALSHLDASRNKYLEAEILTGLGFTYHYLGNEYNRAEYEEKALVVYRRALPMWQTFGDYLNEATCLNGIGNALDALNQKAAALDYYFKALELWEKDQSDPGAWATTLLNIAYDYDVMGNKEVAINYYQQAIPRFRQVHDVRANLALVQIGSAYGYLGDYEKGIKALLEVLNIERDPAAKDRAGEAGTLKTLGILYYNIHDNKTSLKYLREALPIYRDLDIVRGEAETINSIGAVSAYRGAPTEVLKAAITDLEEAAKLYARVPDHDPSDQAVTQNNLGAMYSLMKDYTSALKYYEVALSLSRAGAARNASWAKASEAITLYNISRLEFERHHLREARADIDAAIDIIESTHTAIHSQELRVTYTASVKFYYDLDIEILMQLYDENPSENLKRQAFELSERERARSLRQMLLESPQARPEAPDNKAEASQPALKEVQQSLPADTLLLEFSLGAQRSFLWVVTRDSIDRKVLLDRDVIEEAADGFVSRLTARNRKDFEEPETRKERIERADKELPAVAANLSQILFSQVADKLEGKRLFIVSDGRLQYVPFAALPLPRDKAATTQHTTQPATGELFISRHEIVYAPSASVLSIIRKRNKGRTPAPKTVAVLADPVFDKTDERVTGQETANTIKKLCDLIPNSQSGLGAARTRVIPTDITDDKGDNKRLPLTQCEAHQIISNAPKSSSLEVLGFEANVPLVLSGNLSQYQIVHFATHSQINNVRPELSSIVLSLVDEHGNPRPDGGHVYAKDIYNLKFPSELIVLSSCKTGLGKQFEGEGLVGLTRGFIYAGASRVIVSLWDVNDIATTMLMSDLYRKVLKENMSPSEALRQAQLNLLRSYPELPAYFWAGFVLQGEWDKLPEPRKSNMGSHVAGN